MRALCLALLLCSCAGEKPISVADPVPVPKWVNVGGGIFESAGGPVVEGVGVATNIKRATLRRSVADSHAREEAMRALNACIASYSKDWAAPVEAGETSDEDSARRQAARKAAFAWAANAGERTTIAEHYVSNDGAEFALARLTLDDLKLDEETRARARQTLEACARNAR